MSPWMLGVALAGAPSIDEPPVTGTKTPDDYAVVIANQDYSGLADVAYASRDADAFSAWLTRTRGLPTVNVIRLNGATRKKIEDAVARAASLVPKNGTLWVYYSGHGLGMRVGGTASERVLVGINAVASADEIGENVVPVAALERTAAASPAARVVFVLDSCFNNKDASGEPIVRGSFAVPGGRLAAVPKVTVWTAASEDETARWFDPAQHGAFTYFAVGALSGWADGVGGTSDGTVTLDEAQAYVRRAMSSAGILDQNPEVVGDAAIETTRGKLAAAPVGGFSSGPAVRTGPSGSFGFETDLSSQLATQACDESVGALAEAQVAARAEAEAAKVRQQATDAWAALKPQLDACAKLDDRKVCIAATEKYVTASKAAKVEIPAGVEVVKTACGDRSRAMAARTVPVRVGELVLAQSYLGRLNGGTAPKPTKSKSLGAMVAVPPGTFVTGAGSYHAQEITVTHGFQMMTTEVTQGMYKKLMGRALFANSDSYGASEIPIGANYPGMSVSWYDAIAVANAASAADGLPACYVVTETSITWTPGCGGYRLPTAAEWELAAGAGEATDFAGAPDPASACKYGNVGTVKMQGQMNRYNRPLESFFPCEDGAITLAKVGSYLPNRHGLYDMIGNVSEWVWDRDGEEPTVGRETGVRQTRGGGWFDGMNETRISSRDSWSADYSANWIGFRLVRSEPYPGGAAVVAPIVHSNDGPL